MTAVLDRRQVAARVADALVGVTRSDLVRHPGDQAVLNQAIGVLRNLTAPPGKNEVTVEPCNCDSSTWADYHARRPRLPDGIHICLCTTAKPGNPSNAGTCYGCGRPVVATMSPRLQHRMAAKYPPIVHQRVELPDGRRLFSEHLGAVSV